MKKIIIFILVLLFISLLFFIAKKNITYNTNNSNNINNILDVEKKLVIDDNVFLKGVIEKYNLEDKYVEKTIDGHIVCRTDLNCIFRYYAECKSSDAVFFDDGAGRGFAFVVRGIINNICNVEIFSEDEKDGKYLCSLTSDKLSKEVFEKIINLNSREKLDFCKKM